MILIYLDKINFISIYDAFENFSTFTIHLIIILFVGLLIFIIDFFILNKRIKNKQILIVTSLALGLITAPWFFLFPSDWIY